MQSSAQLTNVLMQPRSPPGKSSIGLTYTVQLTGDGPSPHQVIILYECLKKTLTVDKM